ncbi:phage virion morphogenesis protein [Cedecea sp. NFIX57]|uniref:phage virion morphogenesis protein n=1 Tax=Cedecea sp. NFIX57 TaxID=1566286 RepID=UPI000A0BDDCA|nr:phage virion morphogenesis protein [Cedecea sp. NFIX57]SMG62033.1 phage virion morphogenesis (putative tail completion) protein [Cedecea sp. NFIX57]
MEPEITLTIPPDLEAALAALEKRVKRRTPLMEQIANIMLNAVDENFIAGGRPAWKPLKYRDGQPLMHTRHLHGSITPWHDNDTAVVGTNVVYARIQNQGGKTRPHEIRPRNRQALRFNGRYAKKVNHPGSDIPARPFLTLTDHDLEEIQQAVIAFMTGNE